MIKCEVCLKTKHYHEYVSTYPKACRLCHNEDPKFRDRSKVGVKKTEKIRLANETWDDKRKVGLIDPVDGNYTLRKYWPELSGEDARAKYRTMLYEQKGVCAICKQPETRTSQSGKTKRLSIDHCHTTGRVRGLLCARCNTGIVQILDNQSHLLEIAKAYVSV